MDADSARELLAQLVEACGLGGERAARLAAVDGIDPSLRALLVARSVQYRRAAAEIGAMVHGEIPTAAYDRRRISALDGPAAVDDDTVIACWERAECFTLTCFRDAFDAGLPVPLAVIVKQHFEAGLVGLKALRALPAREEG